MQNLDYYYGVLHLAPGSDLSAIRTAYRSLVKRYHPDTRSREASTEQMQRINHAYQVLSRALPALEPGAGTRPPGADQRHIVEKVLEMRSGLRLNFVQVPAGSFLMGRDPSGHGDGPAHLVTLPEFAMAKYPVTVGQYAAFVAETGYVSTAEEEGGASTWPQVGWTDGRAADWRRPYGPGSDVATRRNHPVTVISWHDAWAFCHWIAGQIGLPVRLPTEAEWEKAARGHDGRAWPWGNQPLDSRRANLSTDVRDTSAVGRYSPEGDSPYGCADMTGNVWQWTSSGYTDYPYRPERDHFTNGAAIPRVVRGGAAWLQAADISITHRDVKYPVFRAPFLGFRICTEWR